MKPGSEATTVDVAIVNHNTRELLRSCLESLGIHDEIATVRVADNGSSDGSLEMLATDWPDVAAASLPHNPGFGAAINELVAASSADVVLVLNADVRLEPGAVGAMVRHLDRHDRAAVVGPRITDAEGTLQRSVAADPSVGGLVAQETGLHHLRRRFARSGSVAGFDHAHARSVPWVLGAVMAIRRTAFVEVGGFDPGFFLYCEEIDLCRRLRDRGWVVRFEPAAGAVHAGGSSTGQRHVRSQRDYYESLQRFHRVHATASPTALRLAVVSVMLTRIIGDALTGPLLGRHDREALGLRRAAAFAVLHDARCGWPAPNDTPVASDVDDRADGGGGGFGDTRHGPERRMDWLVLLPAPVGVGRVVALGDFGRAELSRIAEHFGVAAVDTSIGRGASVDVLVCNGMTGGAAVRALRSVAPTGMAYVGGHDRPGGLRLVRARDASGRRFSVVSRHWMLPDADSPRRFVPLGDPGPLRWYLENLFMAGGWASRLASGGLARFARGARWLAAHQATVLTASDRRDSSSELLSIAEMTTAADAAGADVIVLTSGHDPGSRTVLLPFSPGARRPSCAIKVAGRAAMNSVTEREQEALHDLHAEVPLGLRPTIPQPLGVFSWHRRIGGVESVFDGPTLEVVLVEETSLERRIGALRDVAAWLTELHVASAQRVVWDAALRRSLIDDTVARAVSSLHDPGRLGDMFDRLRRASDALDGVEIPIVRRHFDLGPWNVLMTDRGIGVIDWEAGMARSADGRGLPLCDLDYFVKYWLHIVAGADGLDDERRLFAFLDGTTADGAVAVPAVALGAARRALADYRSAVGVDERFVPVVTAYHWIEHAVNAAERSTAMGDVRVGPTAVESALDVVASVLDVR